MEILSQDVLYEIFQHAKYRAHVIFFVCKAWCAVYQKVICDDKRTYGDDFTKFNRMFLEKKSGRMYFGLKYAPNWIPRGKKASIAGDDLENLADKDLWIDVVVSHVRCNDPRLINYLQQTNNYGILSLLVIFHELGFVNEAAKICTLPSVDAFGSFTKDLFVENLINCGQHNLLKIYLLTLRTPGKYSWYVELLQKPLYTVDMINCTPLKPNWICYLTKKVHNDAHLVHLHNHLWEQYKLRNIRYEAMIYYCRLIVMRLKKSDLYLRRKFMTKRRFENIQAANPNSARLRKYRFI